MGSKKSHGKLPKHKKSTAGHKSISKPPAPVPQPVSKAATKNDPVEARSRKKPKAEDSTTVKAESLPTEKTSPLNKYAYLVTSLKTTLCGVYVRKIEGLFTELERANEVVLLRYRTEVAEDEGLGGVDDGATASIQHSKQKKSTPGLQANAGLRLSKGGSGGVQFVVWTERIPLDSAPPKSMVALAAKQIETVNGKVDYTVFEDGNHRVEENEGDGEEAATEAKRGRKRRKVG